MQRESLTIVYPPLYSRGSSSDYASADLRIELETLQRISSSSKRTVQTTKTDRAGKADEKYTKTTIATMKGCTTIVGDSRGESCRDAVD
jgi:hypothetical protein